MKTLWIVQPKWLLGMAYAAGETLAALASAFGVCQATVGLAVTGVTWAGIHTENISTDNRSRMGRGRRKLTDADVVAIRLLRAETGMPFKDIGERFGVSDEQARRICNGQRRQFIPSEVSHHDTSSNGGLAVNAVASYASAQAGLA